MTHFRRATLAMTVLLLLGAGIASAQTKPSTEKKI